MTQHLVRQLDRALRLLDASLQRVVVESPSPLSAADPSSLVDKGDGPALVDKGTGAGPDMPS